MEIVPRSLGIDLGCTAIKWVVLSPGPDDRRVIAGGTVATPASRPAVLATLRDIVHAAEVHGPGPLGIAVPGHADRDTGVLRFLPNLRGDWTGFPLGAELSATVLNDGRAFALAELTMGAARGHTDALFLTLGTGVGGGVVSAGRLLVGPDDRLGELGHLIHDPAGPPCQCGANGCLEMYASATALLAAMRRRGGDAENARDVVAAALAGDPAAGATIAEAGRAIGATLASVCALLPAEAVVIGGGLAGALPVLRPHIEEPLRRRAGFIGPVRVIAAALGTRAGAIGAALAAAPARVMTEAIS